MERLCPRHLSLRLLGLSRGSCSQELWRRTRQYRGFFCSDASGLSGPVYRFDSRSSTSLACLVSLAQSVGRDRGYSLGCVL